MALIVVAIDVIAIETGVENKRIVVIVVIVAVVAVIVVDADVFV